MDDERGPGDEPADDETGEPGRSWPSRVAPMLLACLVGIAGAWLGLA